MSYSNSLLVFSGFLLAMVSVSDGQLILQQQLPTGRICGTINHLTDKYYLNDQCINNGGGSGRYLVTSPTTMAAISYNLPNCSGTATTANWPLGVCQGSMTFAAVMNYPVNANQTIVQFGFASQDCTGPWTGPNVWPVGRCQNGVIFQPNADGSVTPTYYQNLDCSGGITATYQPMTNGCKEGLLLQISANPIAGYPIWPIPVSGPASAGQNPNGNGNAVVGTGSSSTSTASAISASYRATPIASFVLLFFAACLTILFG